MKDLAESFNSLRSIVVEKGRLTATHGGYKAFDLDNIRVGIDVESGFDSVNVMGKDGNLSWSLSSLNDQYLRIVFNYYRLTATDMIKFAEEFAARHPDERS